MTRPRLPAQGGLPILGASQGRSVRIPLVYGALGIPDPTQGVIPGPTWESPDGDAHDVRVQIQATLGGDIVLGTFSPWPSNVFVWYRIRYWVEGAPFTGPITQLVGGPMTPWPVNASKVEVFFYGITSDASGPNAPQNQPVIVSVSVGESGGDLNLPQSEFAILSRTTTESNQLVGQPCHVFGVRVRTHLWTPSLAMNANDQPGIYNGDSLANKNLVTLSGTAAAELQGIVIRISAAGVVGTSQWDWASFESNDATAFPNASANIATAGILTAAGPTAIGNTGLSVSFAAGNYTQYDLYAFPPQKAWPMLFDSLSAPGAGATPLIVGPELNRNRRSVDWSTPIPWKFQQGCWVRLSAKATQWEPLAAAPGQVWWEGLAATGY